MPNLPAPYVSPWKEFARNLRALWADLGLRGRELWRRNREGDLSIPGFWPNNLLPCVPQIREVLDEPHIRGALRSLVGPDYYLHFHRHDHVNFPDAAQPRPQRRQVSRAC